MNLINPFKDRQQLELEAPPHCHCQRFRILFVIFLLSCAFDFSPVATDQSFRFSILQGLAWLSGGLASVFGFKYLLSRPGVFVALGWWGMVTFAIAFAAVIGAPGNWLGLLVLVGLAVNLTLICASVGMRPAEVVRWMILAAVSHWIGSCFINRGATEIAGSGFLHSGAGAAVNLIVAWSACVLLLKNKFSLWLLVVLAFAIALPSVNGFAVPVVMSFLSGPVCLGLGLLWKFYDKKHVMRRVGGLAFFGLVACGISLLVKFLSSTRRFPESVPESVGAIVVVFIAIGVAMGLSLRAAYLNSQTVMGPRAWDSFLVFYPFVSLCSAGVGILMGNMPFTGFAGAVFGMLLVFPQFYFNRAFFLSYREKVGQGVPQIILDEDFLPDDLEVPYPGVSAFSPTGDSI
ncbi:MAG: hypothetical protein P1U89_06475 [Verrucomicrobiales bacterium]|nr:hypothetical protein [Verrucomicrobiales bacterium]